MIEAYLAHEAERAAQGIPALPLSPGRISGTVYLFSFRFWSGFLWSERPVLQLLHPLNKLLMSKWSASPLVFTKGIHLFFR